MYVRVCDECSQPRGCANFLEASVLHVTSFIWIIIGIPSFQLFYITHKVFAILWYISLLVHAKNFIYWVIGPGVLFILERMLHIYVIVKNRSQVEFVSTHDNVSKV